MLSETPTTQIAWYRLPLLHEHTFRSPASNLEISMYSVYFLTLEQSNLQTLYCIKVGFGIAPFSKRN